MASNLPWMSFEPSISCQLTATSCQWAPVMSQLSLHGPCETRRAAPWTGHDNESRPNVLWMSFEPSISCQLTATSCQ
jgi:hypothetical protein